jgi:hypothetical protein
VKVGLADVIRELEERTAFLRNTGDSKALVYAYGQLASVIDTAAKTEDLAVRLAAVEEELAIRKNGEARPPQLKSCPGGK